MSSDPPSAENRFRTRRWLLATAVAGTMPLVAGCQVDSAGGDDGPGGDESSDDPPYNAAMTSIDDHPITEPLEFEEGQRCPVCNMQPPDYPRWNCQLAHSDGTGLFFDSPGCLLAYHVITESHPTEAPIERLWFTEFGEYELFDAADGFLVKETDLENQNGPMSGSPVPFATRERAVAYVEAADHLGTDAIIAADDIDRELAEFYRDNRMPDS